jgi:hypothetical protein
MRDRRMKLDDPCWDLRVIVGTWKGVGYPSQAKKRFIL